MSPLLTDDAVAAAMRAAFPTRWQSAIEAPLEPHQVPPPGEWDVWILLGGRGSGKTHAGADYMARYANEHPGARMRIIAPSQGDAFESCIDGPSGLLATDPTCRVLPSAPGGAKVVWPNGSEALILGTYTPKEVERLRAAGNRELDWWEEAGANRQFGPAWDQADLGLRLGERPHSIVTTTPRNVGKLRELLSSPTTVMTHGTIDDNPHLPQAKKDRLHARYAGTRLGRQELLGELLTDVPGALWTWKMLEEAHASCPDEMDLVEIVVGVDPAVTSGEDSDDTGIIVCGRGADGRGYVLLDRSCHVSPAKWAARAVKAYDDTEADRIVGEVNNGGDLVESLIRTVRPNVPYKKVHASRGKRVRAEPIAALYEQGRISHVKVFTDLEAQLTEWTPDDGDSPDRLDALVWAFTELGFNTQTKRKWGVR